MDCGKILVVEDYEPLLVATSDVLEVAGYTILTASDGVEALHVMEETLPDLIVADILMPEMDGYAFFDVVRGHPHWACIPFIFLSCKAEDADLERAELLGADGYITKPFAPEKLVTMVRTLLGSA
jgi:CheY-like chemotaxis protein